MLLTVSRGKGNKVHLSLDGEYRVTTTERVFNASAFSDGSEISEEEWAEFLETIQFEKMYERALDLLELRDHSKSEIRDKLINKFGAENRRQAMSVLEKLSENGLLDDEHFARVYAEELIRKKHVSQRGLHAALSAKGVDRSVIDSVIGGLDMDPDESINLLLDTKFRNADLLNETQCDRTITSLYRMGFLLSDIKKVIGERQRGLRLDLLEKT